MKYIRLGDLEASRIGLGAMSMSHAYTGDANWRLQLATDFARNGGTWGALRTVATTW